MADNVVVKYQDNVDELIKSLKAYRDQQLGVNKNVDDFGNKAKVSGDKANIAVKEAGKSAEGTGNLFGKLGAQIAAAFSVAAVIAFGKASFAAFAEAELSARKLNAAIGANGGTSSQFQELLQQSKELQKTTIFSDEQIQSAQTLALQFGLTTTEVKRLIPIVTDFASATGQDLKSALEAVLRGSEGIARGLKVYGIEVETTGTRSQKLAQITEQLTQKFGGQAQEVGETTTGALAKLSNAFNDLQETIGAILNKSGGFIDFLRTTVDDINLLIKTNKQLKDEQDASRLAGHQEAALKEFNDLKAKFIASGKDANDAAKQLIDVSNKFIDDYQKKILAAKVGSGEIPLLQNQIEIERARQQAILQAVEDEKRVRARAAKEGAEDAAKNADKLKEAQQKAAKETSDAQIALAKFTFDELSNNIDLQVSLEKEQALIRIGNAEDAQLEFLKIEQRGLEQRLQAAKDTLQDTSEIEKQIVDNRIKQIESGNKAASDIRPNKKDYDEWLKLSKEASDQDVEDKKEAEEKKRDQMQQTFDLAHELTASFQDLFRAETDQDLAGVQARKDARLQAIDEQIKALEEANDRGRLSDKKLEQQKKALLLERAAVEKKAQAEENKIKRQDAEREKLLSLFRIGLILAEAIAIGNVFRIISASAQLAIVAATPIPAFKKGTKGKKETGLGLVGEEGPELVWMPEGSKVVTTGKTRQYKEAIDSMIEGTFDEKYVYKAMIASALREATRQADKQKQKTFAENIAHLFNVKAEVDPYRLADGIKSNNKELAWHIGKAVAKNLNSGYKNPRYH